MAISLSSDNRVTLSALTNLANDAVINNATVTGTLKLASATVGTFNMTSTGSGGNYTGLIPYSLASTLIDGATYSVFLLCVSSDGTLTLESNQIASYLHG